ncbi:MAG: choice-of-anchor tandem repeat NxxGxxAF-containing protein [Acidobacteriota bacterium]
MRHRQFNFFILLTLGVLCAVAGVFSAGAQQKPADKPAPVKSDKAKNEREDEPVAITPKVIEEKAPEPKALTTEDFGNFRFPIINGKGDVAFLALFLDPKGPNNGGQSIFVRHADGNWKVTREGEKAANLPEGIYGFSLPSLNDNGDLTFFASYGTAVGKQTPVSVGDPNDPLSAAAAQHRTGALYIKNAQGLKSLAKLGDEVPLMPSHFSGFSNPTTNSKGVTAFIGTYSDPDGRGLFMIEDGKMRLIIRSGQKVGLPGFAPNDAYSEHYYPSKINERNEVAFMERIGDRSGIFVSRPSLKDLVELVALTGKPAPVKGANYLGFGNRTPSLSNTGEVAFVGFFDGASAGRGLFFKSITGPVKLVARDGDKAANVGGQFRDFLSPAVNSRGEIAFIGKMEGRNQGLFIKTAKGIEAIAMVDQQIPGGKGPLEVFNNFTQPSINDKGEVVFYGQIKNAEVAIFHRDEKGVLRTLARRGDKMPK